MIARLDGTIKEILDQSLVLATGSICFEIYVPYTHRFTKNTDTQLYIYVHWNQEQGPTLFGFDKSEEKTIFQTIIGCSGVGPKLALTILEHMDTSSFLQCISEQNSNALSTIPGIGKKKAEQLILYLKDKVAKLIEKGMLHSSSNLSELQQISEVLASLNYSRPEINAALEYVRSTDQPTVSFDLLLRKALSFLSKRS
ncbi:MAG: Holliday junction branch migration protein RuvA [Candidatus Babeliales bacterium]